MTKYFSGLPDNIYGRVKSSRPKTLDETIELANDFMDQKLRTYAERQTDTKEADDSFQKHPAHRTYNPSRDRISSGNTNVANTKKGNGENPKGDRLKSTWQKDVRSFWHRYPPRKRRTSRKESNLRVYQSSETSPEVFPKDFPGLPPTRPVEFQIDLIPGAATQARGNIVSIEAPS
ncbi:hypothetical protein Tco_0412523 [Tanacetum coccineum]